MQMLEALLLCIPKSELKLSSSFGFRWSRKSNPTVARVPEAECPAHKVVVQGFGRVVGLEEIRPLLHQAKAQHTHTHKILSEKLPVTQKPARRVGLYGSFRKLGVPNFGVLIKGSSYLGYYIRVPYFRKPPFLYGQGRLIQAPKVQAVGILGPTASLRTPNP